MNQPISFGNTVSWEGRVEQDHRYVKWTVYFRSACGDDLSTFISSITFQLHEDFKPKNRGFILFMRNIYLCNSL